ncbi:MAG: proline--tRNA ligase [Candidatus Wallbacteria bacterium]|nr:proline--tRNA ligase [Candidatus Wallbacteria bacterium]
MRMSQLVGRRFKEKPAEAVIASHAFLVRGGYIRQLSNGIFSLLPPGLRIARKIERVIRDEMNRINGQEVLMPIVQTKELWEESGRYDSIDDTLVRFKDRYNRDMVLAMTHEEAVLHLFRNEVSSYRDLPFMVFQIQTKFRDEPRPRGGLIRVREFTMKDAYSFHRTQADLEQYYQECLKSYLRIFSISGVPEVVVVKSDTGIMGGEIAHEFILLSDVGEDTIAVCEGCGMHSNTDITDARVSPVKETPLPMEKVHTPGCKTIEELSVFLKVPADHMAKVVFYDVDAAGLPVMAVIRGDIEINETKLARIIGIVPTLASEERAASCGAVPGYASIVGLDPDKCRIIVDRSIGESDNLVCGANEVNHHFRNFNLSRDCSGIMTVDIGRAREGDLCAACGGRIAIKKGIEVGNIFQLGTKYTARMGMRYQDENGQECTPIMGCYGIGVGRLVSSVLEAHHDENGPIWPISIAPWQVHINALKMSNPEVARAANELYNSLQDNGIEVLFDDRNESPGIQFADADLLGVPFRLVIGEKHIRDEELEWKTRDKSESGMIKINDAVAFIRQRIGMALNRVEAAADRIIMQD